MFTLTKGPDASLDGPAIDDNYPMAVTRSFVLMYGILPESSASCPTHTQVTLMGENFVSKNFFDSEILADITLNFLGSILGSLD